MNSSIILFLFSLVITTSLADDTGFRCGEDWIALNDEKCFKVLNESLTRDEAIIACSQGVRETYVPSLLTIRSRSEQAQLANYLFNELGLLENVWLGARRLPNKTEQFRWDDGSKLYYKNWAKNRPSSDLDSNCVQLESNSGKWVDLSCDETGLVVCEKLQIWTFPELQNEFFEYRRRTQNENKELSEDLNLKEKQIKVLENSLKEVNKTLLSLRQDFDEFTTEVNTALDKTTDEIESLDEFNVKIERNVSNLVNKTEKIRLDLASLQEQCSAGCSGDNNSGENSGEDSGISDAQLDKIKKAILKEVDSKLEPIEDQLDDTVTDAKLENINYRRALQIKKKGKWMSLGFV